VNADSDATQIGDESAVGAAHGPQSWWPVLIERAPRSERFRAGGEMSS